MQWFKVPEKIYFEAGSIAYLEKMPDIERAFIVTDPGMVKLGYVDKILYHLRKRSQYVHSEIFSEVESDPSFDTIKKGVAAMNNFKPDVIIAVGGGSPMDAAKGMWLFYEHPEADVEGLKLKFMDIRKRTYKFPKLGQKAKMVAIPTTSGTGSEVTSFAVITDKQKNKKYPLADYELTPDVAIVDPDLVMSLPKSVTADTGMDVLTHAIESYVSNMASDYTDGLAEKASELVVTYLEQAYDDGTNKLAREKMHNASTIAGMAFTNAFLGINHSLAHKLGAEFHIPHGRINAILLPYVIKYNSSKPTKFVVAIEQDRSIEGLLILLNTMGGDVEAGLAIAEVIAGMQTPTVSLVVGGGHSIGIPLAVSADVSLIVPSASMTVHPVRTSGLVLGVPQTTIYFSKIQERITGFITSHSRISKARLENMMLNTQEMATDMGTVISGTEAVECGLIDRLGSLRDAIDALYHRIETQELRPSGNAKT